VDAALEVELIASVAEVVVALGALVFAFMLARHESKSRERIEERLEELTRAALVALNVHDAQARKTEEAPR
jgi:hypothetical protein